MIKNLKALLSTILVCFLMAATPSQALESAQDASPTPLLNQTAPNSSPSRNIITGGITFQQHLNYEDMLLPGGFTASGNISDDECLNLADKGIFLVPTKNPFHYKFKCGNLVLFPDHDTVLTTGFGDVCVPKNTIVLLIEKKDSLAVYDLSKDSLADVKIVRPKKTITLNPGMEFVIADSNYKTIRELPKVLTAVSYRGFVRSSLDHPSVCAFTTRFSIASAFELMAPLYHLVNSKVKRERHAFQQAIKTFAVLSDMDPVGAEFPDSSLDEPNHA